MNIVLIVFIFFLLVWAVGVGAAGYHVFKYRLPGDVTTTAFWAFIGASAIILLIVIYFISGINWGTV